MSDYLWLLCLFTRLKENLLYMVEETEWNSATHLIAMYRFLTASVMYVGSVSEDVTPKAPRDLHLLSLLILGACMCGGGEKENPETHFTLLFAEIKTKQWFIALSVTFLTV